MKTAYDVLGVPRNASNEKIGTAFRKAAKACHPDLNAGDPTAELQIRQVIIAYEILKTPHKRAAYDRYLRERCRERGRPLGFVRELTRDPVRQKVVYRRCKVHLNRFGCSRTSP